MIYDKHPLSNYAKVQKVLIDGDVYFDRDNEVSEREAKPRSARCCSTAKSSLRRSGAGRQGQ